ncbi:hypothetical protein R3W88_019315 [Solanum pinnatisectum]|uniref:Uncharacterized protein n=1 Tax=Solanum pinnatisectum TaxID=50273 RepID=A0AAV9KIX4_9SOLN|nr:hypothetical protein R3W88_019315 [Solanum pinnatisectum]
MLHRLTVARRLGTKFVGLVRNKAIRQGTFLTNEKVKLFYVSVIDVDEDVAGKFTYVNVVDTVGDLSVTYDSIIYVGMNVGEKTIVTMVDTGSTHTFVASKIVKKYGLKVTNCATKI